MVGRLPMSPKQVASPSLSLSCAICKMGLIETPALPTAQDHWEDELRPSNLSQARRGCQGKIQDTEVGVKAVGGLRALFREETKCPEVKQLKPFFGHTTTCRILVP